ncbi:MAG: VWA containing CoxE family protein [Hyphomonas sp.]|uniref:vWA domain-containing protein n=1 Tax=Hyphomonas sp. TaxID=87 RepID=UPI000A498E64|nr:VWA domain-containing protein [Hyphomonas sp.]MBA4337632.1 VWA containing CoxE family protein [Hyphomonas sp.]
MEKQISNFIRALRSADVRVSTGEALDAARTVAMIGYDDRALMKDSLACVLAKSESEKQIHDRLFELYFSSAPAGSAVQSAGTENDGEPTEDPKDAAERLSQLTQQGNEQALATAIERAAEQAGLNDIRFSTQVAYFAQSMVRAMGGEQLQARLLEALQGRTPDADAEAQRLIDVRRTLTMTARERAERAFQIFGAAETEKFRDEVAATKRLSAIEANDMARMKQLVAKVAKRLAVKHSRRRKRTQRGLLDVRRTMRANAGVDGIPFNVIWRQKKKDRPKIIVICDVSGSVALYVRFLLLLLFSMKEAIPDLHAFAFSYRLKSVDDILETMEFDAAIKKILREIGLGSTSYGQAFSDFKMEHENKIDRRTTIIILGDGRSNYGDPRLDLFRDFAGRAKRVIWLNPEGRALWGTGDSVIPRYEPFCAQMSHVATLKDLEKAIDEVLTAYS